MEAVDLLKALAWRSALTPPPNAEDVHVTRAVHPRPVELGRARVPEGIRLYAIGDVHGRLDLLNRLLARIEADIADRPVEHAIHVFLGDYIDRGPASKEVFDRLIALCATQLAVFLRGNHETYLSEFLTDPGVLSEWKQLGGLATLLSYGLDPSSDCGAEEEQRLSQALARTLPPAHRQLLGIMRPSFTCGDFFFVHAGIRPGTPLDKQDEVDLLWIREEFLLSQDLYEKVIVHGHTPMPEPQIYPNRINIDTGAYATGRLTCLALEGNRISFI